MERGYFLRMSFGNEFGKSWEEEFGNSIPKIISTFF
jgi:hypothetical protein